MSGDGLEPRRAAVAVLQVAGARRERARRRRAEGLESRDRGLFHELVAGVARREVTLERVLEAFADRGVSEIDPVVRAALLVGLHQIVFLDRVPGHAAVNAAVECVPRRLGNGPRRFVNGLLRTVSRSVCSAEPMEARNVVLRADGSGAVDVGRDVLPDPERDRLGFVAAQWGYEREAIEILLQDFELEEAESIVRMSGLPPRSTVRRIARRGSAEELRASLAADGIELAEEHDGVHVVESGGDLAATRAFRKGWFAVQGPFAARVAPLLAPRPGEGVLDLCAPPGGKSCHLAELAPDARVVALARDAGGARRIRENAARLGCPVEIRFHASAGDVGGRWDAVLLDVPCSNSGVLGRRPEARRRLARSTLQSLRAEQEALLETGLRLLAGRPDARVVYSTCSILSSENATLVRAVLVRLGGYEILAEIAETPLSRDRDGGYACVIGRAPRG